MFFIIYLYLIYAFCHLLKYDLFYRLYVNYFTISFLIFYNISRWKYGNFFYLFRYYLQSLVFTHVTRLIQFSNDYSYMTEEPRRLICTSFICYNYGCSKFFALPKKKQQNLDVGRQYSKQWGVKRMLQNIST